MSAKRNHYLYNHKELQDKTGEYDYGARFYDPVIARWTTVDPLAEKSRRFSPYVYGKDSPIIMVDPDGMFDQYFGENGKYLGKDENGDNGTVRIITDSKEISTIKQNEKHGAITNSADVKSGVSTTKTALGEALNVLNRINDNGGKKEESSAVTSSGKIIKGPQGSEDTKVVDKQTVATDQIPLPGGTGNISIHSHPTYIGPMVDGQIANAGGDARTPGPEDPDTFKSFCLNIIVGNLGLPSINSDGLGNKTVINPGQGAVLYDSKARPQAKVSKNALQKIVNSN